MIRQLRQYGIRQPKLLGVMEKISREVFVGPSEKKNAYEDGPLSIGFGQTISQPFIVAYMTEALDLTPEDRVLEIGTGSGYQTAVLAGLVKEVYTVEIVPELAERSRKTLQGLGYRNIHTRSGDGYQGWPEEAPFDKVLVTAAPDKIPGRLTEQLKIGGRMVLPVGTFSQALVLAERAPSGIEAKRLLPVSFVPMVRKK